MHIVGSPAFVGVPTNKGRAGVNKIDGDIWTLLIGATRMIERHAFV